MKEVNVYAKCVKKVIGADKINYEIHGDKIPHLHAHIYPRMRDDPYPNQPTDYYNKSTDIYAPGEYEKFISDLKKEIKKELEEFNKKYNSGDLHQIGQN